MMELMEMALQLDTIAAIATPVGEGAIGIVRLSGPRSIDIVDAFFKGKQRLRDMKSHRLAFGELLGEDGAAFDTVLVALMRAPHSYTGEDIVEIHCHGGRLLVSRVLSR